MAEDKINPEIQSSQDGTVHSSQETEILNLLFKNFSESALFTSVMNLSDFMNIYVCHGCKTLLSQD